MKYIKKFEREYFGLNDILGEIDITNKIEDFFKKHNLEFVDVNLGKRILRVYYGEFATNINSKPKVYQIIDGKKEELGVGTKRYKVPELLNKILYFLNNMTESDIEFEKSKPEAEKFNL